MNWPLIPLGEVLKRNEERVTLVPDRSYREVTVRLWGKGVTLRRLATGAEIAGEGRFVVRPNQFIASRIDARNGAFGLIPPELDGAIVTNDFPTFNIDSSRLLPEFLGWQCRTSGFADLARAASEGTTNRVRLKGASFLATSIPLPPIEEQRRVVGHIDAIASRVAEAQRLQNMVSKDIDSLLQTRFAQVTQDCERRPFAVVAPAVRRHVKVSLEESYPELGIRSFGRGTFHKPPLSGADVGSKKLYQIMPGDLVFMNVFAWEGAVAVARPEDEGRFGSHRFITCRPVEGVATAWFLWFYFRTPEGQERLGEASPGGAGRNRTLGLKSLGKIPVPIPPIVEQMQFDALQAKFDAVRAEQSATAAELDALLPSVLNRAFAGEL